MPSTSEIIRKLAGEAAYRLAKKIVALGLTRDGMSEGVGWAAPLDELGFRVVVDVELMARSLPLVRMKPTREVEECAFEAAPRHDAEPVTVKDLAALAGYAYTAHFRAAVTKLIALKRLVKIHGKVRKNTADPTAE